jgi:L-amino acid N-acyltransferase YncA
MCLPVEEAAFSMQKAFLQAVFDHQLPKNFLLAQHDSNVSGRIDFKIYDTSTYGPKSIGGFGWSEFPNVGCHIVISHDVYLAEAHRDKGYGSLLQGMREKAFKDAGIQIILATVRSTNAPEIALLKKAGWKQLTDFPSANEAVKIELWSKKL